MSEGDPKRSSLVATASEAPNQVADVVREAGDPRYVVFHEVEQRHSVVELGPEAAKAVIRQAEEATKQAQANGEAARSVVDETAPARTAALLAHGEADRARIERETERGRVEAAERREVRLLDGAAQHVRRAGLVQAVRAFAENATWGTAGVLLASALVALLRRRP